MAVHLRERQQIRGCYVSKRHGSIPAKDIVSGVQASLPATGSSVSECCRKMQWNMAYLTLVLDSGELQAVSIAIGQTPHW